MVGISLQGGLFLASYLTEREVSEHGVSGRLPGQIELLSEDDFICMHDFFNNLYSLFLIHVFDLFKPIIV